MIIEIKDLPEGRKVSRILVDVTFEDTGDSGPTTSQSVSTSFLNESNSNIKSPVESPVESPVVKRDPTLEPKVNPGIPAEMLDMEF